MNMLTAVVPVTLMSNRLGNLENWLSTINHINLKVVIVHDLRDDETEIQLIDMIERLQSQKIRFISGVFGSPGFARNAGLNYVDSPFVCFWDSDDLPNPEIILSELEHFHDDFDVLIGKYKINNLKNNTEIPITISDSSIREVLINPGIWRMIFRTSFIESIRFKDMRMGEDQLFLAEILLLKPKIIFVNACLYTYFVGGSGQLTQNPQAIEELFAAYGEIQNIRKHAEREEFELLSIILARLKITWLKNSKFNQLKLGNRKPHVLPFDISVRHPFLQAKSLIFVILNLYKKKLT